MIDDDLYEEVRRPSGLLLRAPGAPVFAFPPRRLIGRDEHPVPWTWRQSRYLGFGGEVGEYVIQDATGRTVGSVDLDVVADFIVCAAATYVAARDRPKPKPQEAPVLTRDQSKEGLALVPARISQVTRVLGVWALAIVVWAATARGFYAWFRPAFGTVGGSCAAMLACAIVLAGCIKNHAYSAPGVRAWGSIASRSSSSSLRRAAST